MRECAIRETLEETGMRLRNDYGMHEWMHMEA